MTFDIVFDGPPGPEGPRFVEVEDVSTGKSIRVGEWVKRDDGYWALRIHGDQLYHHGPLPTPVPSAGQSRP